VAQDLVIRKRRIGPEDLSLIGRLIQDEGSRGRTHLSRRLCRIWDWRQGNGHYREIACRELLRRLEAKGLIQLPAMQRPARRPGYRNRARLPEDLDRSPLDGPLSALVPDLRIVLAQDNASRALFNGLVDAFHYLGYQQPTGAQLKYLLYYQDRPAACLSFGPAAWKIAPRDRWIGWSEPQRQRRLPLVVNNDRFVVLPWVQVAHLASFFLGRVLRRLAADWKAVYSQRVVLAESFVDTERFEGVCYAASNWKRVGQTQGRGRNDRFTQRALSVKAIWLHPLCRQWRRILLEEGQA
jgi:hypothetical protein